MISPEDAIKKKKEYLDSASWIPKVVIQCFDDMIVQNLDKSGKSKVYQDALIKYIMSKDSTITTDDIFNKKFLDVEDYYRANGWKVTYDKPGYYENYRAFFVFES